MLFDALRGTGSLRENLRSNTTSASDADASNLKTLDSDGFTLGTGGYVNHASTFVSWNWRANGQGSSNTDGSINTTYTSANTTSGFSIVKYTGTGSNATIGHGLGVAPSMVIVKKTSATGDWMIYHKSLGATKYIFLQSTDASGTQTSIWNDTEPTTTVFTVGTSTTVNQSGQDYIAYCFAEKKGFSKFGSYTGNGNADGTFVYTGFKPAFIMIKRTNTTGDWLMKDNKRPTVQNPVTSLLYPNTSGAEATGVNDADFLSNGYKIRTTGTAENASGGSYIYLAFAEAPLVASNGTPATAR